MLKKTISHPKTVIHFLRTGEAMLYRLPLYLLFIILVSGCQRMSGPSEILDNIPFMKSSQQKEGESAFVAGDYDRAVLLLQRSAVEEPDDKELQEMLALAKEEAAKQHLADALEAEEHNDPKLALKESEKAVSYSEDPRYKAQLKKARRSDDVISAQVALAISELSKDEERSDTLQKADALMVYDRAFPGLAPAIADARQRAGEELSREAKELLEQQEFSSAFSRAQEARELSKERRYDSQVKAYKEMVLADRRRAKEDYLTAFSAVKRAQKRLPKDVTIAAYRESLVKRGSKRLHALASKASKEGKYALAIHDLEMLKKLDSTDEKVDVQLRALRIRFSDENLHAAEELHQREGGKAAGRVLIYYLIAQRYAEDPASLKGEVVKARKELDEEIGMRLFIDFANTSTDKGAEAYIREGILKGLSKPAIRGLSILEREAIRKILHDETLVKEGADGSKRAEAREIKGVQLGLQGLISEVVARETGRDRQSYQSVRYQSGMREVPTPEARKYQLKVDVAQKEVDQAAAALKKAQVVKREKLATDDPSKSAFENSLVLLDQTYAENDVSEAQRVLKEAQDRLEVAKTQLLPETMKVKEPVYTEALYPVYDLTLLGEVTLSFRLIDLSSSSIGREHRIHITDKAFDRYIPGDKTKGVVEDPNELPSLELFKKGLLDKAVDESVHRLREEFTAFSRQALHRAQHLYQEHRDAMAVEQYVRFLTTTAGEGSKEQTEAKRALKHYFGVEVAP